MGLLASSNVRRDNRKGSHWPRGPAASCRRCVGFWLFKYATIPLLSCLDLFLLALTVVNTTNYLSLQSAIMTSTEPPAPRPARVEFRDFDNEQVFKSIQNQVMSETAKNFVVEFGADGARVAVDLGLAEFEELLDSRVDPNYPVRWM